MLVLQSDSIQYILCRNEICFAKLSTEEILLKADDR